MRANIFQRGGALLASRRLRAADVASEVNEAVAGVGLFILGNSKIQYPLDLQRILQLFGVKSEPSANADAMCVRNHSGDAENVAEQEVCDLSADAGEFAEQIDVARQLPAVFIAQLDARRLDRRRLCAVKSAGTDDVFDIGKFSVGKRRKRRVFFEQIFTNDIDTRVGALSRKSAHYH